MEIRDGPDIKEALASRLRDEKSLVTYGHIDLPHAHYIYLKRKEATNCQTKKIYYAVVHATPAKKIHKTRTSNNGSNSLSFPKSIRNETKMKVTNDCICEWLTLRISFTAVTKAQMKPVFAFLSTFLILQ